MWQDPIHPVYAVTPIKMDFVRAILSAHPLLLMLDFNNVLLLATLRLALCVRNHSLELGALRTKHDETGRDRWHTWNDRCTCSPRGWFRSFTPLSQEASKKLCFCMLLHPSHVENWGASYLSCASAEVDLNVCRRLDSGWKTQNRSKLLRKHSCRRPGVDPFLRLVADGFFWVT